MSPVLRRIATLLLFLGLAAPAGAADPGRWTLTGRTTLPPEYFQGLAADPGGIVFAGPQIGLHRTDLRLRQVASIPTGIHPDVAAGEGFNHIGDIAYDPRGGGRLLLPLECFSPFQGTDPSDPDNPCRRGAIGIADPESLGWRSHIRLDPAEIPKVMWLALDPSGLAWTQSGRDLLAYDIEAPADPLRAVRRIPGVLPGNCTGAVFFRGRLFCAVYADSAFRIWSLDVNAPAAPLLEIERAIIGEAEGLEAYAGHGGQLHWLVVPDIRSGPPTFGPQFPTLLHFSPAGEPVTGTPAKPAAIRLLATRSGRRVRVTATTTVAGRRFPVRFATARAGRRTVALDDEGHGTLRLRKRGRVTVKVTARGLIPARTRLR
jgi:hypothetical protein